jgi:hypothetical protein
MIIARMKNTISAITLILGIISNERERERGTLRNITYRESQNSISPYARIPKFESPRNITQKMRIQAHCGTASVQYPITREIELYSLART